MEHMGIYLVSKRERRQLLRLYHTQEGLCCYCGLTTFVPGIETKLQARARLGILPGTPGASKILRRSAATREHLHRVADGGRDSIRNLKMACAGCNVGRDTRTPEDWRAEVQAQLLAGKHWRQIFIVKSRAHLIKVLSGAACGQISKADAQWWLAQPQLQVAWLGKPGIASLRSIEQNRERGDERIPADCSDGDDRASGAAEPRPEA